MLPVYLEEQYEHMQSTFAKWLFYLVCNKSKSVEKCIKNHTVFQASPEQCSFYFQDWCFWSESKSLKNAERTDKLHILGNIPHSVYFVYFLNIGNDKLHGIFYFSFSCGEISLILSSVQVCVVVLYGYLPTTFNSM